MADPANSTPAPVSQASSPIVFAREGTVFGSSRDVSIHFGKRHDDVLRRIRALLKQEPSLGLRTFAETPYTDPQNGVTYPAYDMTRDGFALLAMGFTGEKALRFKLAWIEAFNRMETELRSSSTARQVALPRPQKPKRHPRPAPHLTIDREDLAVMRVGGATLLVDLAQTDAGTGGQVVCFDADGKLTVEAVNNAWPHANWHGRRFGYTAKGYSIAGSKPDHHIGVWVIGTVVATLNSPRSKASPKVGLIPPPARKHPSRFGPRSDLKRDLLLLVRSAKHRMAKARNHDLGQALAETLEDLIAREDDPAAPVRGAIHDWDEDRATEDLHRKMRAEGKDPSGARAREVLH